MKIEQVIISPAENGVVINIFKRGGSTLETRTTHTTRIASSWGQLFVILSKAGISLQKPLNFSAIDGDQGADTKA